MNLYVDDWRPAPQGWAVARTVAEAIEMLQKNVYEEVSLDYMIGDRIEDNFTEVAHAIVRLPIEKRPKKVYVHTSSSAGAKTLMRILDGHVAQIERA